MMFLGKTFLRNVRGKVRSLGLVPNSWSEINCNSMTLTNGLTSASPMSSSPGSSSNTNTVNTPQNNITWDLETNRFVWVDLEMTGLDIEKDKIMEVACLVTDSDLNIIAEGPNIVISQPKEILDNMDEWCIKQHGKTGLTQESLNSNITIKEAEEAVLQFVSAHATENTSPLVGSSVYMDRLFLRKHMPKFNSYLHYRIVDVSSIKELCKRWTPILYKNVPKKGFGHRALADIRESVEELKFYKQNFFKL